MFNKPCPRVWLKILQINLLLNKRIYFFYLKLYVVNCANLFDSAMLLSNYRKNAFKKVNILFFKYKVGKKRNKIS